jgi:hypothetical protein
MIYPNGDKYEGEWQDNKKNGAGRLLINVKVQWSMIMVISMLVIGRMIIKMERVFFVERGIRCAYIC